MGTGRAEDRPTSSRAPEQHRDRYGAGDAPWLSVVVPARNEGSRLPETVSGLAGFLASRPPAEIVLAVDIGSTDDTVAVAHELQRRWPQVRLADVRSKGKGFAVRAGVEAARGASVVIVDSDLAVTPEDLGPLIDIAERGGVGIASRSVPGSVRIGEPRLRFWLGRAFNLAVRALILPRIRDSQCGFKAFPTEVGRKLLAEMEAPGWVFDVEFLARARLEGIEVVELPVVWRYGHGSTVEPLRDLPDVVGQLWRVRRTVGRQRIPEKSSGPPEHRP